MALQSELCRAIFWFVTGTGYSATELAFGKQGTQLVKLNAQSMPKRAFRPQLFLKQFLCLVEGRFISFRIVDDFPKHALHS